MSIKNSETEKNLLKAFAGESQARNRYTYYAGKAYKEGFVAIAKLFEKIANQEKEHAKRFFSFLEGRNLEIQATFPTGVIGTTLENLRAAAAGENEEHSNLYPTFAEMARKEGFTAVAELFENIAIAEKHHEEQYSFFAEQLSSNKLFKRQSSVSWQCLNCGYRYTGEEPPKFCPACAHPQDYFTT